MRDAEILNYSFGYLHPPQMRFAGYVLLAAGATALISGGIFGLLIGVIGYWLSFKMSGTQLRIHDRMYRPYTSSFGIKRGKWVSYAGYPDLAALTGKEGFSAYSRGMVELKMTDTVYDIYLLKKDHRRRLILKRCQNMAIAKEEGERLADTLGLKWTVYSPRISKRTRMRRRQKNPLT